MSSDSEDDCYGNVAQKLQSMKNKYSEDKIETTNLLESSHQDTPKTVDKVSENTENSKVIACEVLKDDSDCEEISLDAIIAQNSKKKATRRSKRNADISTDNIITTRSRKRSKAADKANNSASTVNLDVTVQDTTTSDISTVETPNTTETTTSTRTNSRGRGRGRRGGNTTATSNISTVNSNSTSNNTNTTNAAGSTTNNSSASNVNSVNSPITSFSRGRRRGRRSNAPHSRGRQAWLPDLLSTMLGLRNHSSGSSYPTYSVGNTDEYPDESYNQPLFTNKPKTDDVMVVEENDVDLNDSLDDNEELSVKVYWQNRECVKFTLRRFQKLQPIFDFFADREKVSPDKLFFTYNDKILKKDDTPDTITYNIVKFIDGGIVNQSVSNIVQDDDQIKRKDGIKLKFQCQNMKKPFETYLKPEDKLIVAMVQCAEHLEKPLDKLKFLFDGDTISGKNTPKELDLEGGECIDVKLIS